MTLTCTPMHSLVSLQWSGWASFNTGWLPWLAVEQPWSPLARSFLNMLAQMGIKTTQSGGKFTVQRASLYPTFFASTDKTGSVHVSLLSGTVFLNMFQSNFKQAPPPIFYP